MLAVGQWRTVIRIDHFWEEMILPYCRTITRFDALHRHARPHHFREAINIQRRNTQATFDLRAHPRCPRLCAKDTGTQRTTPRVTAHLALQLFNQVQTVGWRDHNHVRFEIANQLRLFLGLTAGHRDNRCPQAFRAVVRAQSAGEKAIAISDVDFIFRGTTCGTQRAGDDVSPGIDIILRIAHHRRFTRGAG